MVEIENGGISNKREILIENKLGKIIRKKMEKKMFGEVREKIVEKKRKERIGRINGGFREEIGLGMEVEGKIGNIGKKIGGEIMKINMIEKLRSSIDEKGSIIVRMEFRMIDDRLEEGEVS